MGKAILIQARPLTENPRRNQPRIRPLNFGRSRPSSPQLQSLQSPPQLPKFGRRFSNCFATQPPEITADACTIGSNFSKGPDRMPNLSPQSGRSIRILTTAGPTTNNAERLAMRAHRFLNLPAATKTTGKVTLRSYPRPAPRRFITEPNFLQSKSEVPQKDVKPLIPTDCVVANSETEVAEINFAGSHDGYDENGDNNGNQDGQNRKQNCNNDDDQNGDNDDDQDGDNYEDNDNRDDDNDNKNGKNDDNQDGDNDCQNGYRDASKTISEACNEFSGLDTDDTVEMSLEFRKKLEAKVLKKEQAEKAGPSGESSPAVSTDVSSINDEPLISSDLPGSGPPEDTVGVITRSRTRGGGNGSRRPPFRRRHSDDGFSCYRHTHWKKILLITYLRGEIGNASGERAAEKAALERIRSSWAPLKSHTQKLSSGGSAAVKRKRQVSRRRQVTTDKKMKK